MKINISGILGRFRECVSKKAESQKESLKRFTNREKLDGWKVDSVKPSEHRFMALLKDITDCYKTDYYPILCDRTTDAFVFDNWCYTYE
jgi:hypothetical protein